MTGEPIRLQIPKQDLSAPTACAATPRELAKWLEALPIANIGETARSLYQYTSELSRVAVPPETRLQLAEQLRPLIRHATRALERHYLNQPVVLPPQILKITQLAQTLQGLLAKQYVIICAQCAIQSAKPELVALIPQAIHRALSELGQVLLRSGQLYTTPPARTWHELHQLYLLAEQRGLLGSEVADLEHRNQAGRIEHCYLQALLFGCSKTNQLRQADIAPLFDQLGELADCARLSREREGAVFCIDPEQDFPARYVALIKGDWEPGFLGLDTSELLARIHRGEPPMQEGLRTQLDRALSAPQKRHFTRIRTDSTVEVCAGLSALHYMLCDGQNFDDFLAHAHQQGRGQQLFGAPPTLQVNSQKDVWDKVYQPAQPPEPTNIDYKKDAPERASAAPVHFHSQQVQLVNASAGGCCLNWQDSVPPQIRAGEVMGIRHPGHSQWSITVIRWLSTQEDKGTLIGLELLSPGGTPIAVRVFNKAGAHGDYMRGIELPAVPLIGQPATLLLPRVPFRERQKVQLVEHDKPREAQLLSKITGTSAVAQFSFELSQTNPVQASTPAPTEGFDAIWDKL